MPRHYDYLGINSLGTAIAEQMRVLSSMGLLKHLDEDTVEFVYKMLESCTS
jgi:replication initiation and membrane attachment protein DnaB